ncbi:MAG: DUF433 domain-containing protein [Bacteroidetes bacterium]|nr:DUF433 domain-containing protein [Bacteroidota bacterium]
MNLKEYITIDPNKRFGRPILIGTGISVSDILNCLGIGMTKESILNDLPALTEPVINAALFYAASRQDHPGFAL